MLTEISPLLTDAIIRSPEFQEESLGALDMVSSVFNLRQDSSAEGLCTIKDLSPFNKNLIWIALPGLMIGITLAAGGAVLARNAAVARNILVLKV